MILALTLFIVMYVILLALPRYRWITALIFAAIFVMSGILPVSHVVGAVDWNVILMLTGTMILVQLLIESRMPARLAEMLLQKVPNVQWAVVSLSLFAGIISAFVDNVATVLMVAPIGLAVAKKLSINPVPIIISIAVSSNLQGAATLVGDTTSIMLGSYANMSFNDFFWFHGQPGIFLSVELGALATVLVLLWLFRNHKEQVETTIETEVTDHAPGLILIGMVASLIMASQFENKPELTNGLLCMAFAAFGLVYERIRNGASYSIMAVLKTVDYRTLLLLTGLFIVIEGITEAGVIAAIASLFVEIGGQSPFQMYLLIVVVSVLISAFVDNIPYVATMLPVVQGIASSMGIEPYVLYYGLLIGATLGGNLTPIGASANIAAIGILYRSGFKVSALDFLRIGVPFTLTAVVIGCITNWLIWGL
jgi:Na+/H+ antiporter NhaD/arsenite permease-like protein